jgi:hypothetical protein
MAARGRMILGAAHFITLLFENYKINNIFCFFIIIVI